MNPRLFREVKPQYTSEALDEKITGTVGQAFQVRHTSSQSVLPILSHLPNKTTGDA